MKFKNQFRKNISKEDDNVDKIEENIEHEFIVNNNNTMDRPDREQIHLMLIKASAFDQEKGVLNVIY